MLTIFIFSAYACLRVHAHAIFLISTHLRVCEYLVCFTTRNFLILRAYVNLNAHIFFVCTERTEWTAWKQRRRAEARRWLGLRNGGAGIIANVLQTVLIIIRAICIYSSRCLCNLLSASKCADLGFLFMFCTRSTSPVIIISFVLLWIVYRTSEKVPTVWIPLKPGIQILKKKSDRIFSEIIKSQENQLANSQVLKLLPLNNARFTQASSEIQA